MTESTISPIWKTPLGKYEVQVDLLAQHTGWLTIHEGENQIYDEEVTMSGDSFGPNDIRSWQEKAQNVIRNQKT